MREIKYQAWLGHAMIQVVSMDFIKDVRGVYEGLVTGYFIDGTNKGLHTSIETKKAELRQFTGLHDKNGKEIYEGDRLRFYPCEATPAANDGCIWDGTVVIEDGVPTIRTYDATQVSNPNGWDQEHDWIKSRWWSATVGYGEYGSWNVPRTPLTKIHTGFGSSQEHFKKFYEPIAEKLGWGKRFINAEVIGNIYENPELLQKEEAK